MAQFSREYMSAIANDLKTDWFVYRGSNIETTREFCKQLTKKEYVHRSEIPEILKGHIDRYRCKIYERTGLPYGMKEGTTPDNFMANCGGWNCQHELIPVPKSQVPTELVQKFAERPSKQQVVASRKSTMERASENIIGKKVFRKELNADIEFTKKGIKEAIFEPHDKYLEKNRAIQNIVEALKTAEFMESADNRKPDKKPNAIRYHYFAIDIAGVPSQIVVEENKQGKFIFYDISRKKAN
jgi:hypothetical protein